jgi:murein DD-endopeptidase MepM/ murein hydrolase activator NlpD
MLKIRNFFRKAFTSITIMIVPHSRSRLLQLKLPFAVIAILIAGWGFGTAYAVSIGVRTARYLEMSRRLEYFSDKFYEMRSTLSSLQTHDKEFRQLLAMKSKKVVLEKAGQVEMGYPDVDLLKKEINEAMVSVAEVKQYIKEERDAYYATPTGWPAPGVLSSVFGRRLSPQTGEPAFHSGVDIRVPVGTPVKATADGVISVSGWVGGNGNIVYIEHGHEFSTAYAHNSQILVKVGQRVKRGDTIALSGATGNATGPHIHYEVWKRRVPMDPIPFLGGRT